MQTLNVHHDDDDNDYDSDSDDDDIDDAWKSAVFSPDGCSVLAPSNGRTAKVWSVITGECTQKLKGHRGPVTSAVFSPDGLFGAFRVS